MANVSALVAMFVLEFGFSTVDVVDPLSVSGEGEMEREG